MGRIKCQDTSTAARGLAFPAFSQTSLSLRLSAQFLFSMRTAAQTSLSLSASAQFLFSMRTAAHTSLSLSASAQFLFSMRTAAHTYLSLSATTQFLLSPSLHLLSFCSACRREEQSLIQLNTDISCLLL